MQSMFSNHNGMKLESNNKEIWEMHRCVEIKQHTAKYPVDQKRNHREISKYFKLSKNENVT